MESPNVYNRHTKLNIILLDEGFGAIAIPFVIAALLIAGAVIWSMCK